MAEQSEVPDGMHEIRRPDGRVFHVPDAFVDWFFDGKTGDLLTDEQWDEQIRRIREFEPDFKVSA